MLSQQPPDSSPHVPTPADPPEEESVCKYELKTIRRCSCLSFNKYLCVYKQPCARCWVHVG